MPDRRHVAHRSWWTGAVLLVLSCFAQPAQAQLGALRRAAERKLDQSAEDRMNAASLIAPTFDNTTVEITADRLDRYMAALQTQKAQGASNRQRYDAMQAEAAAVRETAAKADNSRERVTYERSDLSYRECRGDAQQAAEDEYERKMEELSARMQRDPIGAQRDPKMKEIMAALQESGRAQQSGDTVAQARTTQRLAALMGISTDSVAMDKLSLPKCGARPAKPRSLIVKDSLEARAAQLNREAGALLTNGSVAGSEVGMTDLQARMMWERVQSWLNGMQKAAPITRTFTKAEYDLLVSRRSDLRKAFSGS